MKNYLVGQDALDVLNRQLDAPVSISTLRRMDVILAPALTSDGTRLYTKTNLRVAAAVIKARAESDDAA